LLDMVRQGGLMAALRARLSQRSSLETAR